MTSLLTRERPDLWGRTVALATRLTGYEYAPKLPLADGTIYACGVPAPSPPMTPAQELEYHTNRKTDLEKQLNDVLRKGERYTGQIPFLRKWIREVTKKIEKLGTRLKRRVVVPEGAMEWILHEVGHWIAATPEERAQPNYGLTASEIGHDGDREWQAWAWEEIVLGPFGPSRLFAPPTQRDGAAFSKAGPMPWFALRHIERRLLELPLDVEEWRVLYGEWIRFERGKAVPSWERWS